MAAERLTTSSAADVEAARLLLARLGVSIEDLQAAPRVEVAQAEVAVVPTFGVYVPRVMTAMGGATAGRGGEVYRSSFKQIVDCWAELRLDQRTGHALACLYAADRYHHFEAEIRPLLASGYIVISDRYVASGLVIQRFDNLDPGFLWRLNEEVEIPDLAVILEADPAVIADRLDARGAHNRFQLTTGSSHTEATYYKDAKERLVAAGFNVLTVDCTKRPAEQSAAIIATEVRALLGSAVASR